MLESFKNNLFTYEKLSEEEQTKRGILGRLVGVIADSKNPTRNGRLYSKSLWENVFNDPIMKEKIENRCCFGELGHPADREEVDPEKIAICLAEQPKVNDKGQLLGVFDILSTPCGKILKTLCDYGCNIGVSSRGSGDILANDEVDPDTYCCECWDAVLIPAVKTARMQYVTESLDKNRASLMKALQESYIAANDEDKKAIKESLDSLNLSEAIVKEDDIPYEDPDAPDGMLLEADIPVTPEEIADDSSDDEEEQTIKDETQVEFAVDEVKDVADEIKELVDATPKESKLIDKAVEEKVKEKAILPEDESPAVDNTEVKADGEPTPKADEQPKEATDDGDDGLFESLKELVRQKDALENEVKDLKSNKTVCDAEVKRLTEELEKYKIGFMRVSALASKATTKEKENKALSESIVAKDARIKELSEKIEKHTNLTESLKAGKAEVKALNEKLQATISEAESSEKALNEQIAGYRKKLMEKTEAANRYKAKYEEILEHYIMKQAERLAVRSTDITSRLNEGYTLSDIDDVCDELLTESVGWSSLPFGGINRGQGKIQVKESLAKAKTDDDGFDELLELAGLK